MARVVDWRATLRTAYERGVRLHLEVPPGSVLSGLARPVFADGRVLAIELQLPDTELLRHAVSVKRPIGTDFSVQASQVLVQ